MKLKPMADNLLLKQAEAMETTASGIILAAAKEKPAFYEVISAGPDVKGIVAGDRVVVGNYTGSDIKLDGIDYKFVKLEDVLAVVTD